MVDDFNLRGMGVHTPRVVDMSEVQAYGRATQQSTQTLRSGDVAPECKQRERSSQEMVSVMCVLEYFLYPFVGRTHDIALWRIHIYS